MRRTKIVCTMGPNTNSRDLMKKLIETGMDVAFMSLLSEYSEKNHRVKNFLP